MFRPRKERDLKDPHIHVEQQFALVLQTGGILNYGKTHHTGCDRRRPANMFSTDPQKVTCIACREHAARVHAELASAAEAALTLPPESFWSMRVNREDLEASASEHRELSARFTGQPRSRSAEERLLRAIQGQCPDCDQTEPHDH
jgi:hypothetical protein